jgi:hypothetical protein
VRQDLPSPPSTSSCTRSRRAAARTRAAHGVALAESHADAVRGAALVISAVTASQAWRWPRPARRAGAGRFFLDFNSASPGAKIRAAEFVNAAGGRYVEGAVMTSCRPTASRCRCCSAGPTPPRWRRCSTPRLRRQGGQRAPGRGQRHQDVPQRDDQGPGGDGHRELHHRAPLRRGRRGDRVAAETFPGIDWEKQGAYFFQRVIEHGRRRSEEVREVAETVREAGLTPWSRQRHRRAPGLGGRPRRRRAVRHQGHAGFARSADWRTEADRILAHLKTPRRTAET